MQFCAFLSPPLLPTTAPFSIWMSFWQKINLSRLFKLKLEIFKKLTLFTYKNKCQSYRIKHSKFPCRDTNRRPRRPKFRMFRGKITPLPLLLKNSTRFLQEITTIYDLRSKSICTHTRARTYTQNESECAHWAKTVKLRVVNFNFSRVECAYIVCIYQGCGVGWKMIRLFFENSRQSNPKLIETNSTISRQLQRDNYYLLVKKIKVCVG